MKGAEVGPHETVARALEKSGDRQAVPQAEATMPGDRTLAGPRLLKGAVGAEYEVWLFRVRPPSSRALQVILPPSCALHSSDGSDM